MSLTPGASVRHRIGLSGYAYETTSFVHDEPNLIEEQVEGQTNAGFDDDHDSWTVVGEADSTAEPVAAGGDAAIQTTSVTGQPVGASSCSTAMCRYLPAAVAQRTGATFLWSRSILPDPEGWATTGDVG